MEVVREESYKLRFLISPSPGALEDEYAWTNPALYILAFKDSSFVKPNSVKEFTVDIPLKPPALTVIKSNNYILNAM
jgi:hypothetical protein